MELLDQIEIYLARHAMPPSKFGRLAVGDPRFVEDLRGGRLPRANTCDRVHSFLRASTAAENQQMLSQGIPSLSPSKHPSRH